MGDTTDRKLTRIHTLIQGNVALHQTATVIPRGYAIPIDTFLAGEVRFARKLGSVFPVLTPHNTMYLSQDVKLADAVIYVRELLDYLPVGAIISFQGLERHFIVDTVDQDDQQSIEIDDTLGLLADHSASSPLYLHAVPLTVTATAAKGTSFLSVSSAQTKVFIGDRIELLTDADVPGSAVEYIVSAIPASNELTQPYTYTVTLSTPLLRNVEAGSTVYLRAFPGFQSETLPLPTQETIFGQNVGPFVWDVMENRMHDGVEDVDTVLALQTIDSSYTAISTMAEVAKNTPHWNVPIPPSSFVFWDLFEGSFTFLDGSRKFPVAVPNELGDFLVSKRMIPNVEDVEWRATFTAVGGDATLRIGFHLTDEPDVPPATPSGYSYDASLRTYYREVTLSAGMVTPVLITSPVGYACDRIDIGVYCDPSGSADGVVLRDWSQTTGRSSWVRYTLMAPVNGDYTWGSAGLLVKPLFYNFDHLRLVQRLNSGAAMV